MPFKVIFVSITSNQLPSRSPITGVLFSLQTEKLEYNFYTSPHFGSIFRLELLEIHKHNVCYLKNYINFSANFPFIGGL